MRLEKSYHQGLGNGMMTLGSKDQAKENEMISTHEMNETVA
jgi:hypothetical protein